MYDWIPSADVRNYIRETGFRFTDAGEATVLYNQDLPLEQRHQMLRDIARRTDQAELKQEIEDLIARDQAEWKSFVKSQDGYFYELFFEPDRGSDKHHFDNGRTSFGYWASYKEAYLCARAKHICFQMEKYRLRGGGAEGDQEDLVVCFNPEKRDFCSSMPVAGAEYNPEGRLMNFWTEKMNLETNDRHMGGCCDRLEERFVSLPNPFERGDIVCLAADPFCMGVVETSGEAYRDFCHKVETDTVHICPGDWMDCSIKVCFFREEERGRYDPIGSLTGDHVVSHEHIHPLYLERVYPNQANDGVTDTGGIKAGMLRAASELVRGQGSLDYFIELYTRWCADEDDRERQIYR